ncbi:hypothetical protein BH23GEM9_BH23GEM9_17210 [soil metagenome]
MRRRRVLAYAGAGFALVLLVMVGVILFLAQSDWGREHARRAMLEQLAGVTDGRIEIGRVEGNLLRRVRLIDVTIVDEEGRPFLRADTIATGFSVRHLLRRQIVLSDVRLVRPVVVLDRPPGEKWNYVRIFRIEPDTVALYPQPPGWGDWVELHRVDLVRGRVTMRTEWKPPDDVTGAERERAVQKALSGETREVVVEVPGGWQNVMDFRSLTARLPLVIAAHPDTAGVHIEVARFAGIVQPFSPPAADVRDLSGNFRIVNDSLRFSGIHAVLPGSRIAARGVYALQSGDLLLHMRGGPLSFPDMRWLYPPLPDEGGGSLRMRVDRHPLATRLAADEMDLAVGAATIRGSLDITTGDTLKFGPTDLRFARVETGLLEDFMPALEFPRPGELTGRLAMQGPPQALEIDGDVRFDEVAGGTSRIVAQGVVGIEPQLRFRNLRVRLLPLQASLARAVAPDLPVRGTIEGFANLTGRPDGALQLDSDLTLRDPQTGLSRVRAVGGIDQTGDLRLNNLLVRTDPLRADLLREYVPALPAGATLIGTVRVDGFPSRALHLDGDMSLHDRATGISRFGATGRLITADEVRFDDLLVRLHSVQLALLREYAPDLPDGTLEGAVRLNGAPSGMMHVDGELVHADASTGRSEIGLSGGIAMDPVRFRDLALRFDPLRMRLVQAFAPDLPLGGVITGTATLNGSPADEIAVRGDLVHLEAGERSHVVGSGVVATGPGGRARVDAQLQPLSLVTAGRFAPGAGLRGSVSGPLHVSGRLADLRLSTELSITGGGVIRADGSLDLASEQTGYDLDMRMSAFNLSAMTWRAPAATDLTGSMSARGRGFDPATMTATIAADLAGSEIDDVGADLVRLRLVIDDGLATIDSSIIQLGTAEAVLDGSFGLTAARHGVLHYHVSVDSLHAFASWLPGADTAVAPPHLIAAADNLPQPDRTTAADTLPRPNNTQAPAGVVAADAVLGADSALIAAAAGAPAVPRDSLAGSLEAAGTLSGNIESFDAEGRARVENFVYAGTAAARATAEYALRNFSTTAPDVTLTAEAESVVAGGLSFDHVTVEGEYRGSRFGEGRAVISAVQDDATEFGLDASFTLSLERNELRLADASMRFDTIGWRTTQPATVSWGDAGIEVDNIELVSDAGGRIMLDGRVPVDGAADMQLAVENVEVAQLATLLQSDVDVTGRLDLQAQITGTQQSPLMEGTATLTQTVVDGSEGPDVRMAFNYADRELTADAEVVHEDRLLADAAIRLPVDLAFTGVSRRLLPGPLEIDIRADSLPIEAIPPFSEYVEDARGRVAGNISVRGTFDEPVLDGIINIDLGSVLIVPLGVRFEEVGGTLSLDGRTITVDSIVATSAGTLRITGEVDVGEMAEPVFDLVVTASNARVIDTRDMRFRLDADLAVTGPLTAIEVRGDAHARSGMVRIPRLNEMGRGEIVNLDDQATFERVDTALVAARDRLLPDNAVFRNLDIDVALTIDRDVWLRSPEAHVEIYTPPEVGPLRIGMSGVSSDMTLLGTINADRGEYEFMGRRFNLTRGAVTFTGEEVFDPFIQVAAEHEVRLPGREGFQIRVVINGTLSDFGITLESSAQPPISQTDLLSYVAFGRDASSLLYQQGSALSGQGGGAGELVGNVAGMATQQLAAVAMEAVVSQIESDVLRQVGLDVFRITPADLPAEVFTGSYIDVFRGTEIEGGRYVSPRLFVAGQIRAGLNRPGIRMEYWTPAGFQWQATWQSRFVPSEPTLTDQATSRRGVLGAFLFREWRF